MGHGKDFRVSGEVLFLDLVVILGCLPCNIYKCCIFIQLSSAAASRGDGTGAFGGRAGAGAGQQRRSPRSTGGLGRRAGGACAGGGSVPDPGRNFAQSRAPDKTHHGSALVTWGNFVCHPWWRVARGLGKTARRLAASRLGRTLFSPQILAQPSQPSVARVAPLT